MGRARMTETKRPTAMADRAPAAPERRELPIAEAEAIKHCLTYLEIEANRLGLGMTAHLIAVAAETVQDSIARTKSNGFKGNGTKR